MFCHETWTLNNYDKVYKKFNDKMENFSRDLEPVNKSNGLSRTEKSNNETNNLIPKFNFRLGTLKETITEIEVRRYSDRIKDKETEKDV